MALVTTERVGGVVTLTLDRPEARNALSIEMCNRIVETLEEIDKSPEARVVVIRGAGQTFCSGADFAAVSSPEATEFVHAFERMLDALTRHRHPTIASIQGAALGGGLQLAMTCDFRIAGEEAKLGIPSSKIGILVNFENIQRLVLLAGVAVAKEVMLTGRNFSGAEAAGVGLITTAVPANQLYDASVSLAVEIAGLAPQSVQGAKRAIQLVVDHLAGARTTSPAQVAEFDRDVATAYGSADLSEGLAAMKEKRPPNFTGN
jgi:methylglutaconyl-CoA hydratase